jgi:hypothetical protein
MKKEDFECWVDTLSPGEQKQAKSYYTIIQKNNDTFESVPYSEAYADLLKPAAAYIREAADELKKVETTGEGVRIDEFLASRADAFESNDYLPSELNWLRLGKFNKLEVTVGPYEQYTDALFTLKSAYSFYIHIRDEHSSQLLEKFSDLQFVEDRLPIPEKYRNDKLVAAPIVVVNQLYAAGDVAVSNLFYTKKKKKKINEEMIFIEMNIGSNDGRL